MTTKAFVLIETVVGKNKEPVNELTQLEGVKSVDAVTGPHDIIVVAEGGTFNEIGGLIINKSDPIPSISQTVTCLVI